MATVAYHVTGAVTNQVISGPGSRLEKVVVNTVGSLSGITLYDGSNEFAVIDPAAGTLEYGIDLVTGLKVTTAGTGGDVTIVTSSRGPTAALVGS